MHAKTKHACRLPGHPDLETDQPVAADDVSNAGLDRIEAAEAASLGFEVTDDRGQSAKVLPAAEIRAVVQRLLICFRSQRGLVSWAQLYD